MDRYNLNIEVNDKKKGEIEKHRIEHFLKQIHILASSHDFELSYFLDKVEGVKK